MQPVRVRNYSKPITKGRKHETRHEKQVTWGGCLSWDTYSTRNGTSNYTVIVAIFKPPILLPTGGCPTPVGFHS